MFWPRDSTIEKQSWVILAIESKSLLVAPLQGGPASRIALPSQVATQQEATVTAHDTYFEVKLDVSSAAPTRARPDLEIEAPLSTAELREALPPAFACSTCQTPLVNSSGIIKYNALPSEHWAELLDAWMCHQDQTLSADLVAKGKGIKPREGEGLVASTYLLFDRSITSNWTSREQEVSADSRH